MEIATNDLRQIANLRVADDTSTLSERSKEELVIHELLHVVTDRMRREYLVQAERLPTEMQSEYIARYNKELENVVEHLAQVLYDLQSEPL